MDENGKVSIKLDIHGTPAENLQRLITDCGVSPHKVRPSQEYSQLTTGPRTGPGTPAETFRRQDNRLVLF
jgi:hypothetical protein